MATIPLTSPDNTKALVNIDSKMMGLEKPPSEEATIDAPRQGNSQTRLQKAGVTQELSDALMLIRNMCKEANAPRRQQWIRKVQRAFEQMKNNAYVVFNEQTGSFDTLSEVTAAIGTANQTPDLYQHNDNVYQMLGLTLIAAMSVGVPKTRYQPVDAQNESDIQIAQQASTIQSFNERRNSISALLRKELLYLWCAGSYWGYTRDVVDAKRAGVTRTPIISMVDQQISPDRYLCSQCGAEAPDQSGGQAAAPPCPKCNQPMSDADWYQGESMPVPVKMGEHVAPNHITAMDVYCGLNVDTDFDAQDMDEVNYLDLVGETSIGAIRAAYPDCYDEIQPAQGQTSDNADQTALVARNSMVSPTQSATNSSGSTATYSRCWLTPSSFYLHPKKEIAFALAELFPQGVKLVSTTDKPIDAVPESLTDKWTWCPTLKGFGMYPFAIGDAALDVQTRINDTANSLHAYMDRLAFGTILGDGDYLDAESLTQRSFDPGNFTMVYRNEEAGLNKPLSDMLFQPQFHVDSKLFEYGPQLIQLMQAIAGIQPQTFGGSDPNVQTKGGQEQALRTAMGRMQLFWDQIKEEHAQRAENSVRCTVANMDDQMKVVVEGDVRDSYQTVTLMREELSGDFTAYPESDEGFPSTYQEIQDRLMKLFEFAKGNDYLMGVLDDPDTQKLVARYVLPDNVSLPGDAERARLKQLMHMLSQAAPIEANGPDGQPMPTPSILPKTYDDMAMAESIAKTWLQKNWRTEESNPQGFNNVLLFLETASQLNQEAQVKQAAMMQAQQPHGPGGPQQ